MELDLENINARTRNSEYNPSRFHGVVMRLRDPRTTGLIFRTGKVVTTGARNEQDSLLASKKFARIIQKLGYNVRIILYSLFKILTFFSFVQTFVLVDQTPIFVEIFCFKHYHNFIVISFDRF